jgi:hypothetical protein
MIDAPSHIAEEMVKLADDFSKLTKRYVALKKLFAEYYKTFREDHKSDASLERCWDLTVEGQEMNEIKYRMKAKEIKIKALSTYVYALIGEIKNQIN